MAIVRVGAPAVIVPRMTPRRELAFELAFRYSSVRRAFPALHRAPIDGGSDHRSYPRPHDGTHRDVGRVMNAQVDS
jgi:hypothetical protein